MAKVTVSFPSQFLRKVDRAARSQGRSRSGLIREALRGMSGEGRDRRSWKEAVAPLQELEERWVGQWDSTEIIRLRLKSRLGLAALEAALDGLENLPFVVAPPATPLLKRAVRLGRQLNLTFYDASFLAPGS